jgi:hypothetical protein
MGLGLFRNFTDVWGDGLTARLDRVENSAPVAISVIHFDLSVLKWHLIW